MNKTQRAIAGLAIIELILLCVFIPQIFFRMQDSDLSKSLEGVTVEPSNLSSFDNSIYNNESALTLEEKIDIANSYDSTVTSILLEKGEKYSANQICSISAVELEAFFNYYEDEILAQRLKEMEMLDALREYGNFLEQNAVSADSGYADVDTVDEMEVDLEDSFVTGANEIRLEPYMYINSAEPDKAFIVWTINYYNSEDGTTLFIYFDDETGRLLGITGSVGNFLDKPAYSLYPEIKFVVGLIKNYYNALETQQITNG